MDESGRLLRGLLRRKLNEGGLEYDEALLERLGRFAELLQEWNVIHNLTADASPEAVAANVLDSLYPHTFVEKPDSLLDVGTGAGFPGLILAAAWPEVPTVLCEPLKKRAAFLRYAALEMGLDRVTVARRRVEELRHAPFGLISSRAVSDTGLLLKLTAKLSDAQTRYLFYKGSRLAEEIETIPPGLRVRIVERVPRRYLYLLPQTEKSVET
ncbi:16S rRNA (guanine(527)-N(7))-methyltransferase RsmG [Nitratifractor sp.]|uniref:16S rRNA (guanine(527)-N(7))-methyltransferase RsmG n=1 Tax=Nitratifractor sp. TaxID=2268144 RepID=UPI0025CEAB60|nr:16S rRNA (guanine(527)-N(7))-methyltransferase RsmG [Nitratifractor sp.]